MENQDTDETDNLSVQMDEPTRLALQDKYIAEMTLPNQITDPQWAEENGISDRTIRRWKQSKAFKQRQAEWVNETHFNPTKLGAIWANMFKVASTEGGPHAVAAAKMVTEQANKWNPPKKQEVDAPDDFESMSVEQLQAAAFAAGFDSDTAVKSA